ncbi:hypothetical protein EV213_101135 [Aureibacillus halotolerans]|uniref:Uncharacterized protein n=1 Tax=Aureibacillus halotolerans TaxID=1508390 RepID=A0A4R6UA44_9BACI|nr:hypothetical protein EV213_101135 [Aureibacillus halotolerans]
MEKVLFSISVYDEVFSSRCLMEGVKVELLNKKGVVSKAS